MKKFIVLIAILITATSVAQQQGINYKALIKDANGNVLNAFMNVQFTIYATSPTGSVVYQEDHNYNTVDGLLILNIGTDTSPITGVFADIDWAADTHFLNTTITYSAGTIDLGTTQFMAVPYAKHANTATIATTALNAGATRINDLSDGKSDNDGSNDGSSLFLGLGAGANDNGTNNLNVGVGYQALFSNAGGFQNTANGYQALYSNVGVGNSSFGGHKNTANGYQSLYSNIVGQGNTANGFQSLYDNTTGSYNTANGIVALSNNTTGSNNTANGFGALSSNTTGSGNVALGYEAGYYETGSNKLYIANSDTTTPLIYGEFDNEILTINGALEVKERIGINTNEQINPFTYFTIRALQNSFGGMYIDSPDNGSPFYGYSIDGTPKAYSYYDDSANSWKLNMGGFLDALIINNNGTHTISSDDDGLVINPGSGVFDEGILINSPGYNGVRVLSAGQYGGSFIGGPSGVYAASSVNTNPDIILGGTANTTAGDNGIIASNLGYEGSDIFLRSNDAVVVQLDFNNDETGEFEIKNGNQVEVFEVNESGIATLAGYLIQNSDRRLKKDIQDLPYGLKEILKLQPKTYNWKSRTTQHKSLGLIAQDVQTLIKEIVTAKDDDAKTLGISYIELIPVLINAIKEQQAQIEAQNLKISDMSAELQNTKDLEQRVKQIEAALKTTNIKL